MPIVVATTLHPIENNMRFLDICLAVAAITQVYADSQFVSLPFVAVDRKGVHTSAWNQRLDESGVNVPLQNMDLAVNRHNINVHDIK
ncbi:predicted protein [Lichtheimia corymbifera JMRC:FSU:9682]|uniref:Uncharacterized protein n=1 Tax=Lichtheimia corymbifera JMRC:FSU:9682 TaxID=1263082 RepID=A0A068RY44_9FUNG|nr:predicted protein [Lichtheimia corymbifera JMRC:FSU:9682]